jgi:glycosyltransferase involved in cell wall biosynthesis
VLTGRIDDPADGALVHRSNVVVRGWHTWAGRPVAAVAVEANGVCVVVTPGNESRPDVAWALGEPGLQNSGWRVVLDLTDLTDPRDLPDGRRETAEIVVTVWGSPADPAVRLPPVHVRLSDEPVESPTCGPALVGCLDQPAEGELVGGLTRLSGWAIGRDQAVSQVRILVDGHEDGAARLGMPRIDLGEVFAEPHAVISGFEYLLDLSEKALGPVRLMVTARAGTGEMVELADRWVQLAPSPGKDSDFRQSDTSRRRSGTSAARRHRLLGQLHRPSEGELNLGVVTHSLRLGGAELWLKELLLRSGAGRSFPCRVLSFNGGPLVEDLEAAGIEVHVTQGQPPPDAESYEGRVTETALWLAAGGHNAALVNTALSWMGADAAGQLGIPVVWAIHESWKPAQLWDSLFPVDGVAPAVRATLAPTLRRAEALVFVAQATRRLYLGSGDPARTVVVPYGIDLDEVDAVRRRTSRQEARACLGVDPAARMILALGVVQPRKAQTVLAAAFAEIADEFPEAFLAVVGDTGDPYGQALAEYLRRRGLGGRTRLVPQTNETALWYRAADAFVCGSDIESMPRTVLEALAFGLPVAATSVFGAAELLTDGETGYLFEPRDTDAVVGVLRRLLGTEATEVARVAAEGRRLAVESLVSTGYTRDVIALLNGLRANPTDRPAQILSRVGVPPAS